VKLIIKDIVEAGKLELSSKLDANGLGLSEQSEIKLIDPAEVKVNAEAIFDEIVIKGTVRAELELICSRCAEAFKNTVESKFDITVPKSQEQVDISEEARQSFLLSLPVKPLCKADCKGLCPICGMNFNRGACSCKQDRSDPRLTKLKDFKPKI